jgi:hypothetical protein
MDGTVDRLVLRLEEALDVIIRRVDSPRTAGLLGALSAHLQSRLGKRFRMAVSPLGPS